MKHIWLVHSSKETAFADRLQKEGRYLGFSVQYDTYGNWGKYDMYEVFFRQYQGIERIGIVVTHDSLTKWIKLANCDSYFKEFLKDYRDRLFFLSLEHLSLPECFVDIPCMRFDQSFEEGICDIMEYLRLPLFPQCTQKNWRSYIGVRNSGWQEYQKKEQEILLAEIYELCLLHHWYLEYSVSKRVMLQLSTFYPSQHAYDCIAIWLDEKQGGIYRIGFVYREDLETYEDLDFSLQLHDLDEVKKWLYEEMQKRLTEKGLGELHHAHCDNLQIKKNDEPPYLILERFEAMRFRLFGHYQAIHERSRLLDDKIHGNRSFTQEKRRHHKHVFMMR